MRSILAVVFVIAAGVFPATALPALSMLEPDGRGEGEYGADVRCDPWDMSQSTDIDYTANIGGMTWVGGVFSGVSTQSNPQFHVTVPTESPIWADRYQVLTLRISVSTQTACAIFWRGQDGQWHNTAWTSLTPGWNTITLDLGVAEPSTWTEEVVTFRVNPCSASGVSFSIDHVLLHTPDFADDSFLVTWQDGNPPGAVMSLYRDDDATGFNGTLIQAGIPAAPPLNQFEWDMSQLAPGRYYVYGVLSDGVDSSRAYSAGAVYRNDPPTMTLLTPDGTPLAEADDYATTVWVDPMNMTEDRDIDRVYNLRDRGVVNGVWFADSVQSTVNLRLVTVPIPGPGLSPPLDLFARGRFPMDSDRYTQLSFRMYLSEPDVFQVFWYDTLPQPSGSTVFYPASQGWATYVVDLVSTGLLPPYTTPWQSGSKVGLRLDPTTAQTDTVAIDWVRISHVGDPATFLDIQWYAYDPDNQATIDLFYQPEGQATPQVIATGLPETDGYGSYLWDTSFLPPGNYSVYAEISDPFQTVVAHAPGPLYINHAPLLDFVAPSPAGQDDYATVVRGDAWDMNEASDVYATQSVSWWVVENGIMSGQTNNLDSWVMFPLAVKVAAEKYHRLSYRLWLEGPQDIGLGSITKAYYRREGVMSGGGPCILEEGWRTYAYDLKVAPLGNDIADTVGWADSVTMFRLDMHEFPYPPSRVFHLDYLRICSDDWGDSLFMIKWWADDPEENALVSIYYDTDSSGFDGVLIASGLQEDSAVDSLEWDVSGLTGGYYYLYAVADDGLNLVRRYALAPLRIDHPPALVLTEPNGVEDNLPAPEDYATDVREDPWDFSEGSDISWVHEITDTSHAGGIFRGTLTGSPASLRFDIPAGLPVNADNYGILSFRMSLSHSAAMHLFWEKGGSWSNNSTQLPVYEGWRTYRIDLDSVTIQGSWSGQVQGLQLSIFYASDNAVLELDWATLTKEGAFADTIRWQDWDLESDASISLHYDVDQTGADGDLIVGNLSENSLVDAYVWDCSFLAPGVYYPYGVIDDSYNPVEVSYSPAPFIIGTAETLPTHLEIVRYGSQSVKLMWDYGGNPPAAVTGFVVYRSDRAYFTPSPLSKIAEPAFPFYVDYAPGAVGNPNLNYYYRVTVRGTGGLESPPSNVAGEFDFDSP